MKKILIFFTFLILFLGLNTVVSAHNHFSHQALRSWKIKAKTIEASFLLYQKDTVVLEQKHAFQRVAFTDLSKADQDYVLEKQNKIENLNLSLSVSQDIDNQRIVSNSYLWIYALILSGSLFFYHKKNKNKSVFLRFAPLFLLGLVVSSFGYKMLLGTDPKTVDAAFQPFKPNVKTHWDNDYFYIESQGISTTHDMMTGITAWQQQVSIPQCYIGSNAWQVPLNPVIAATPVPVNAQHFARGAVAIAANGVPIFNPYTNTGIDALVDGQLDNWGGHSGRGDDYHYHVAPLHLYDFSTKTLPIAYALDGFAVYGAFEPDASAMKTLDNNHGHYGSDGTYHYHGTKEKPYMIGNMVGKVTEDNTMQIIPQPSAKSPRPATTPLKGATITSCKSNATNNGYVLAYTLNNQTYKVDYSWTTAGVYTYKFIAPDGTSTTSTYNGQKPCSLTTAIADFEQMAQQIVVFPNPTKGVLNIELKNDISAQDINEISVFDLQGKKVFSSDTYLNSIDLKNFEKNIYLLKIGMENRFFSKKIIVE